MAESFGASSTSFTPDKLLCGDHYITDSITVLSGTVALTRGALLGKVTVGAITPTYSGTGNGTSNTASLGIWAIPGAYTAKCVTAATNGGSFEVRAPNGNVVGTALVGVAFTSNHINFTISDGATDFVVGDTFTYTVAAGSGKYKLFDITGVVGEAIPAAILAEDVDASGGDKVIGVYIAGEFSEKAVSDATGTNYSGLSAANTLIVKDQLKDQNIYLKNTSRSA